jgi:hypothetical protein
MDELNDMALEIEDRLGRLGQRRPVDGESPTASEIIDSIDGVGLLVARAILAAGKAIAEAMPR